MKDNGFYCPKCGFIQPFVGNMSWQDWAEGRFRSMGFHCPSCHVSISMELLSGGDKKK